MSDNQSLPDSFEKSIEELESIVAQLEKGDATLDMALSSFERGVALAKHSQKALNDAEQKVKILLQNKDGESLNDWQENNNG